MSSLYALLRKDLRVVYRDSLLVFLPVYALVLALAMRWAAPLVPIEGLELYLAPAVVLFGTLLLGTVLGFTLIEEREQGTWLLLRVLPLPQSSLLLYLGVVSTAGSMLVSLLAVLAYGCPIASGGTFAAMLVAGSLLAPLTMLTLGAFASNKIEGLAVSKIVSAVLMLPVLVFLVPMPWQLALAWLPGYWVYLGLLAAYAPDPGRLEHIYWPGFSEGLLASVPILLSAVAIVWLTRRFLRRAS